jgi:hypothetical protein
MDNDITINGESVKDYLDKKSGQEYFRVESRDKSKCNDYHRSRARYLPYKEKHGEVKRITRREYMKGKYKHEVDMSLAIVRVMDTIMKDGPISCIQIAEKTEIDKKIISTTHLNKIWRSLKDEGYLFRFKNEKEYYYYFDFTKSPNPEDNCLEFVYNRYRENHKKALYVPKKVKQIEYKKEDSNKPKETKQKFELKDLNLEQVISEAVGKVTGIKDLNINVKVSGKIDICFSLGSKE